METQGFFVLRVGILAFELKDKPEIVGMVFGMNDASRVYEDGEAKPEALDSPGVTMETPGPSLRSCWLLQALASSQWI